MSEIIKITHNRIKTFAQKHLAGKEKEYSLCYWCSNLYCCDEGNSLSSVMSEHNMSIVVFECPHFKKRKGKPIWK